MNDQILRNEIEFYQTEIEDRVVRDHLLRAYWPRVSTRIIVTNRLDAHLDYDTPNDVAVYYFAPGVSDEELVLWKIAVQHTWLDAIEQHFDTYVVAGMRRGIVLQRSVGTVALTNLTAAERDDVHQIGYNLIRFVPGSGYVIWGAFLWRNGVPQDRSPGSGPNGQYKHLATPLSLME